MKKNGLTILPPSLQEEVDAIKAQEDEKYRVDALMRLTRKLYMGLDPTVKNLTAIAYDIEIALSCWIFGGVEKEDSPIGGPRRNPYMEDIQWVYPFQEFLEHLCHIKKGDSKIVDRTIQNFSNTLYGIGQNHRKMCASLWCRHIKENPSISDFLYDFGMAVDDFEDVAEMYADEGSYLSQEWRKLEDELRRKAGIITPTEPEPSSAENNGSVEYVPPPYEELLKKIAEDIKKFTVPRICNQAQATQKAMDKYRRDIKCYNLWRGDKKKGLPGTSVKGCLRTLREKNYLGK